MAHSYGSIALPVAAPGVGEAAGDPALTKLGAFLKAIINAYGQTAWDSVGATTTLAAHVFEWDPKRGVFHDRELPAIYLWRESLPGERIADGYDVTRDQITVLWVPEPIPQERGILRQPFEQAIYKAVRAAIYREAHPSWVDATDAYAHKATFGSNILTACGFSALKVVRGNMASVVREIEHGKPQEYPALQITLEATEHFAEDASVLYPDEASIKIDVENSDETHGEQVLVTYEDPPPSP